MNETISEIISFNTNNCDVELTVYEYTINIFGSLLKELDKIQIIQDYCVEGLADPNMFFQEGESVIDYATGKHTADSTFMKIIKFIPKLFIGMGRAALSMMKGGKGGDDDPERSYPRAVANLANASPQQLEQVGMEVKQMTDGSITFDTRKSEFWLGERYRHARNWVRIIKGFAGLGREIKNFVENDSNEYKTLAAELSKLVNKEKNLDAETMSITLDAFHQLMKEGQGAAGAISGLADELSSKLAKKMDKDFAKGKDPEKWADAKKLLDGIYDVNIKVHDFSRLYNWGVRIINFVGNDRKIFGLGRSAKDGSGRTGEEKILGWAQRKLGGPASEQSQQDRANAVAKNKAVRNEQFGDVQRKTNERTDDEYNADTKKIEQDTETIENTQAEARKKGVFGQAVDNVKNMFNKK